MDLGGGQRGYLLGVGIMRGVNHFELLDHHGFLGNEIVTMKNEKFST